MENAENYLRFGIKPMIDLYVNKIDRLFEKHEEQAAECWIKQIENIVNFTEICKDKKK